MTMTMTMTMTKFMLPSFAWLTSLALLTACPAGDDGGGEGETTGDEVTETTGDEATETTGDETETGETDTEGVQDCSSDKAVCMTVTVPDDFVGTPVQFVATLYPSLPPAGPPAAILAQVDNPTIGVGAPLEVQVFDVPDSGDFFVYLVLFNEGGGMLAPVSGVDYVGQTETAVTIGGAGIDLGELPLTLYVEP